MGFYVVGMMLWVHLLLLLLLYWATTITAPGASLMQVIDSTVDGRRWRNSAVLVTWTCARL
jgi:threonine/homoserine/homoserine lactone efflux protein